MKDEALRLALEALECALSDDKPYIYKCNRAITTIKQALEQPEPEPVGYLYVSDPWGAPEYNFSKEKENEYSQPLYTSPPKREWQGLTDEEMHECWDSPLTPLGMKHARMIEAKLKEKNT